MSTELKALKNDLSEIKSAMNNLEEKQNKADKDTSNTESNIKHLASQAGKQARELFDENKKKITAAGDLAVDKMSQKPITTALVAFASGALVASVIRRGRK